MALYTSFVSKTTSLDFLILKKSKFLCAEKSVLNGFQAHTAGLAPTGYSNL